MDWKIYYGDGSTFSSDDGAPHEAPALNVQAIAEKDERVGRTVLTRFDFYVRKKDGWYGVDMFGMLDHFMSEGLLKCGRTISTGEYNEVVQQATNDPDLPPKTATANIERRNPHGNDNSSIRGS